MTSMYSLKAQKNTNGEAMSAFKVGAKAGSPPFIWAGVGDGPMYQKKINKSLKTNNKYFEPIKIPVN